MQKQEAQNRKTSALPVCGVASTVQHSTTARRVRKTSEMTWDNFCYLPWQSVRFTAISWKRSQSVCFVFRHSSADFDELPLQCLLAIPHSRLIRRKKERTENSPDHRSSFMDEHSRNQEETYSERTNQFEFRILPCPEHNLLPSTQFVQRDNNTFYINAHRSK